MKRSLSALVLGCLLAAGCSPKAPVAERRPHPMEKFGDVRQDDYFWLNDKNDPKTIDYLNRENAFTDASMRPLKSLRKRLYAELLSHVAEDDVSVPYREGEWLYWHEIHEGQSYPIYYRKPVGGGERLVVLDLNELAKGKPYLNLGEFDVSDDGQRLAYTLDFTGGLDFVLFVKDLTTGELIGEPIEQIADVTLLADSRTLLFTRYDDAKRPFKVDVMSPGETPRTIYEESDRESEVSCGRSLSGAFVMISSGSYDSSEVRVVDAKRPTDPPRLIAPRRPNVQYDVDHSGETFFIRINDAGRNFRLVAAPVANPGEWTELIAARDDVMIEGVAAFESFVVLELRENGRPALRVMPLDGEPRDAWPVTSPVWLAAIHLDDNAEFKTDALRVRYESLATPPTVADVSLADRSMKELKRQPVPNFDGSKYEERRTFARAKDGTSIPVTLVYRKGLPPGPRPAVLWGYGSYGISEWPWFAAERLPMLDRGVVMAVAQLRGGGDYGQTWADAGKLANKMNTFTDFIAAAHGLVDQGVTTPDQLVIHGASAGGLLVGAVTNLEPALFKGVVLEVPFVDVLTTMLDDTLPLTTQEYTQWGNPNEREAYARMKTYSPYDNLSAKRYPRRLVLTSINDNQVRYHEPTKYVARSRALGAKGGSILLKCDMNAGHAGASGRYASLEEIAFVEAWALDTLGQRKAKRIDR